jgi:hypothetical protein
VNHRQNFLGFGEKKVTYHRSVGKERQQLLAEARREKRQASAEQARERREEQKEARAKKKEEAEVKAFWKRKDAQLNKERAAEARKERARSRKRTAYMAAHPGEGASIWSNPAVSGVQYRLAQAVLDGTARSSTMSKKAAQEIVDQTPARLRSEYMKRNPRTSLNDAAALSESWHGRPAERATDYNEAFRYRGSLTDLGRLQEIAVLETDRKAMLIRFPPVRDKKGKIVYTRLASSENGKQLYIVGGDQSLDLGALGIVGEEAEKDLIPIGEVHHVVYVTAKQHLGKADKVRGPYQHVLGENSGVMPILMYDRLNQQCGFAGGNYHIDPQDYDGKHSAGLRD